MSRDEIQRMDDLARKWQAVAATGGRLGPEEQAEYDALSRQHQREINYSAQAGRNASAAAGSKATAGQNSSALVRMSGAVGGQNPSVQVVGFTVNQRPPGATAGTGTPRGRGATVGPGIPPPGGQTGGPGGPGGGGPGGDAGGASPAIDVNVVSSIPLRVWVDNLGRGQEGLAGGGPVHAGAGPGDNATPHLTPFGTVGGERGGPAGLSLQEEFQRVFSGGYASGYPIRNLGILARRAREFGGKALQSASRIDDALFRGAGKRSLRRLLGVAKSSRAGRALGSLFRTEGAASAAATGARGGAAAAAAGAAGGAEGAVALAAAGGPVTATVGAIVALGAAAVVATQEVYNFARAQEDEVRRISEQSGAAAGGLANLDVARLERDIAMGRETEDSSERLLDGIDKFEQALHPIEVAATKVANLVGGALLETIGAMLEPLGKAAEYLSEILDHLTDNEVKRRDSMAGALDAIASRENWEISQGMKKPQYPGAGPETGGGGYWGRR